MPSSLEGKVGRVTGRIANDTTGEVKIEVRGTVEAFLAYPYASTQEPIERGREVIVMSAQGRSVYVQLVPSGELQ